MSIRNFGTKLGKNYAWEVQLFYLVRSVCDGFTPFKLLMDFDWYVSDHKPSFEFGLVLLNFSIFELTIYNIYHCDDTHSPMYNRYTE